MNRRSFLENPRWVKKPD